MNRLKHRQDGAVRFTMWAGILAPVLLASAVVFMGMLNPDYDDSRVAVSAYGMERATGSAIMNGIGFGVTGLLVTGFYLSFVLVLDWSLASTLATLSWFAAGVFFACLGGWPFPHPYHVEFTLYFGLSVMTGVATGTSAIAGVLGSWILWISAIVTVLLLLTFPGVILSGQSQFGTVQRFRLGGIALWMVVAVVHLVLIDRQVRPGSQPRRTR